MTEYIIDKANYLLVYVQMPTTEDNMGNMQR